MDIEKLISLDKKRLMIYGIKLKEKKKLTNAIKKALFFIKYNFVADVKPKEISFELKEEVASDVFANINDITFEVTDNCNLKCKYCGYGEMYGDFDKRENMALPFSFAKNTIDFIFKHMKNAGSFGKQKKINISFYGGEPLLKIALIKEIIDYLESLLTPFTFEYSMTTNGVLVDKHIEYLIQKKFDLAISLDGNEQNNAYRVFKNGTNSFNKVFENIEKIKLNYPNYYYSNVNILAVLHNKNSIIESSNFCTSSINKTPSFSELSTVGVLQSKKKVFSELFSNISEEFRKAHRCSILINKDVLSGNPFKLSFLSSITTNSNYGYINYADFFLNRKKEIPTDTCLPFQRSIFVTVNGKLLPCETIGHKYAYGKVDKSACDINFHEISNSFNNYINKYAKQCNNCYSFDDCSVCVFDLLDKKDNEVCANYTNYESYKKYLTRIIKQLESTT